MTSPQQDPITYSLSTKNLFNHFLLLHDFLYKFTKVKAPNNRFFDAQLDIQNIMNKATNTGGLLGQVSTLAGLVVLCVKSSNLPLKFTAGFLYMYWINHFYTLGSYAGALVRIPSAYMRAGQYYENSAEPHPNALDKLDEFIKKNEDYEDTQKILKDIFP